MGGGGGVGGGKGGKLDTLHVGGLKTHINSSRPTYMKLNEYVLFLTMYNLQIKDAGMGIVLRLGPMHTSSPLKKEMVCIRTYVWSIRLVGTWM